MKYIDLRSDTVTRPSPGMREAIARAEVGDDVYGEDPTVNTLQERAAALFGKEAALFVPSGVMGNEIAIKAHTRPGDEIVVDENSHIFVYETGGPGLLSGVQMKTIAGERGYFTADQLRSALRGDAYYLPKTGLVCLENTHGRAGGVVVPLDAIRTLREVSLSAKVPMHLDGARIWNASVATGVSLKEYASSFDSVSACFSKGLGAPIGSILLGSRAFIADCRKYRKIFGGGMRQAGILAAAALYALDNNIGRLEEDHRNAKGLAEGIGSLRRLRLMPANVETNMVIFDVDRGETSQSAVLDALKSRGVLMTPARASSIRAVTHMDVSREDIGATIGIMKSLFS